VKVYVAIINDRHADTEAYVFSTAEAAIGYARSCALEYARQLEDFEEKQIEGWLYYATYSCESDSVWVTERTIDEPAVSA
jgi:hypothetical protein